MQRKTPVVCHDTHGTLSLDMLEAAMHELPAADDPIATHRCVFAVVIPPDLTGKQNSQCPQHNVIYGMISEILLVVVVYQTSAVTSRIRTRDHGCTCSAQYMPKSTKQ